MSIRDFLNMLLGRRNADDSPGRAVSGSDYSAQLEAARQDKAVIARRECPDAYRPISELSADPICPYCAQSLGSRKPPSRRSKFACDKCGNVVYADPWHRIFPSCYLNAKQALIARHLGMLDKSPATAGTSEDFWWAAQQKEWLKAKDRLTDSEAADALWTLMNYCVAAMPQILPQEELGNLRYHSEELQKQMKAFRAEEKNVNAEVKAAISAVKKGAQSDKAKIPLQCPSCHSSIGKVNQPSRRSTRKCKSCGEDIVVDPKQKLFDSPFLTARQSYLADTLAQLDHWVFADGSIDAFDRVRKKLGKPSNLDDDEIAEVLRVLIVENIKMAKQTEKREREEYLRILGDDHGSGAASDGYASEMVENLLKEFDDENGR